MSALDHNEMDVKLLALFISLILIHNILNIIKGVKWFEVLPYSIKYMPMVLKLSPDSLFACVLCRCECV